MMLFVCVRKHPVKLKRKKTVEKLFQIIKNIKTNSFCCNLEFQSKVGNAKKKICIEKKRKKTLKK